MIEDVADEQQQMELPRGSSKGSKGTKLSTPSGHGSHESKTSAVNTKQDTRTPSFVQLSPITTSLKTKRKSVSWDPKLSSNLEESGR